MSIAFLIMTAGLALMILWALYWGAVRPVLVDNVARELFWLSHDVSKALAEEPSEADLPALRRLEKQLRHHRNAWGISASQAVFICLTRREELEQEKRAEKDAFSTATPEAREISSRLSRLNIKAMLVNSPSWWMPLAAVMFLAAISFSVREFWTAIQIGAEVQTDEALGHDLAPA